MKQPTALRLAEWSDWFCRNVKDPKDFRWKHMAESAAELRRLHEANQAMLEVLKEIVEMWDAFVPTELTAEPHLKARAAVAKGEKS